MSNVETVDVVVVGSGGAGMAAAITAAAHGLRTVLLEKDEVWGGTTARSGGGVWIPDNDVLRAQAPSDELGEARRYLHHIVNPGRAADSERIDAYLDRGPEALRFLTQHSALDLMWVRGYSDYFPEAPGGRGHGRSVEPRPIDGRRLGADLATPCSRSIRRHRSMSWCSSRTIAGSAPGFGTGADLPGCCGWERVRRAPSCVDSTCWVWAVRWPPS